jgi:hypothetical protein
MLPNFLLPESISRSDGMGPEIGLGSKRGKLIVLTLGVTRVIEQEILEVSVWGSSDGEQWGCRPLASFPPKYYCGVYSILLNLASHPDVKFARMKWKMNSWSRGETTPMFAFYLYAEEYGARIAAAAVA